jgi:hypothetical protein
MLPLPAAQRPAFNFTSDDVSQVMAPSTHLVPAATGPMSVQLEPSQSANAAPAASSASTSTESDATTTGGAKAGVQLHVDTSNTGTDSTPAEAAFESWVEASDDVSQVMAPSTHLV